MGSGTKLSTQTEIFARHAETATCQIDTLIKSMIEALLRTSACHDLRSPAALSVDVRDRDVPRSWRVFEHVPGQGEKEPPPEPVR